MAKPKVHMIAAEIGIHPKTLIRFASTQGYYFPTASKSVEPSVARRLRTAWDREGKEFLLSLTSGTHPVKQVDRPIKRNEGREEDDSHAVEIPKSRPIAAELRERTLIPRSLPGAVRDLLDLWRVAAENRPVVELLAQAIKPRRYSYFRSNTIEAARVELHPAMFLAISGVAYLEGTAELVFWHEGVGVVQEWKHLATREPKTEVESIHSDTEVARIVQAMGIVGAEAREDKVASGTNGVKKQLVSGVNNSASRGAGTSPPSVVLTYKPMQPAVFNGRSPRTGSHNAHTRRWKVSGHYRNQWYPSKGSHARIWVSEHTAGPAHAPLLTVDRVVVT